MISSDGKQRELVKYGIKNIVEDDQRVVAYAPDYGEDYVFDTTTLELTRKPFESSKDKTVEPIAGEIQNSLQVTAQALEFTFQVNGSNVLIEATATGDRGSVTWIRMEDEKQTYLKNMLGIQEENTVSHNGWYYFGSDRVECLRAPAKPESD